MFRCSVKIHIVNSGLAGKRPGARAEAGPWWVYDHSCSQPHRQTFNAKKAWPIHSCSANSTKYGLFKKYIANRQHTSKARHCH